MSSRTVTRTVETDTEPLTILRILSDPRLIPRWAPVFADTVEPDSSSGWLVSKAGSSFSLEVSVNMSSGTVDYLRELAPGKRGGAFIRVLPRPAGGCVVVMTLPVPPAGDTEKVGAILDQELDALAALGEKGVT